MKRIASIFLMLSIACSAFSQSGYRYSIVPGSSNTFMIPVRQNLYPVYAATIALTPTAEETFVNVGQLTGALTMTAGITKPYTGDKLTIQFNADATNRVVTFSTGFTAKGALTVIASTYSTVRFQYNGAGWIETGRTSTSAIKDFDKSVVKRVSSTAYTANTTVTATELVGGLLTITSGTDTLTLPTATNIGAAIGTTAGTIFDFVLLNIASGGSAVIKINTGIIASGFPGTNTLSLANSATVGVATFRLTFISATVATLTRTS